MAHLFLTEDYLKKTTIIGEGVDMKILTPIIEYVQDVYLLPLLGHDLYDLIMTQDIAASLSPANTILFNSYLAKVARSYVVSCSARSFKFKYTNKGIMASTSDNGTPISESEIETLIDEWKSVAERYGELMINYIWDNSGDFPTYWTMNGVYRQRPRTTAYDSPLSFASKNRGRYYHTDLDKRWDSDK